MNTEDEFPSDVITPLHAGRKIDVIKLLREHRGIGLKEAKHDVETYARDNAATMPPAIKSESSAGRLVMIVIILAVGYVIYDNLS